MARKMIRVTQANIDAATPRHSEHCMIADAVREAMPDVTHVAVDLLTVRYSRAGKRYVHLTPRSAQTALIDFDQADPRLQPFEFRLEAPVQTHQARTTRRRTDLTATTVRTKESTIPQKRGGKPAPRAKLAEPKAKARLAEHKKHTGKIRAYGAKNIPR
jgi:hypothetical protein